MRILLTGATGFIGSRLNTYLLKSKHTIVHVLRTSSIETAENLEEIVIGDITSKTNWETALNNVDVIIHLAARAHVLREDENDPITIFRETNCLSTLNLARQAVNAGVRRFIFISSIGVNGNLTYNKPFTAKDTPNPTEPYAISKHEAEVGLFQTAIGTGMDVVVIRPPLVYGANAPGNFGQLIKFVLHGIPLPLGNINNQRSFVAIENLIDLIYICLDHPAAANQTFLVSDDEDISTTDLLIRLNKALGKSVRLLPIPQSLLEVGFKLIGKSNIANRLCGNLQVDINSTKKLLNWKPPVSVNEALQKTADAYLVQRKKKKLA